MKVFNQSDDVHVPVAKLQVVLVLDRKEAQILVDAMAAAVECNPRKITWKRLYDELYSLMDCD
jgi:hypothetical protein